MAADVRGDAYEGLLEKNAQGVRGGARQHFKPAAPQNPAIGPGLRVPGPPPARTTTPAASCRTYSE